MPPASMPTKRTGPDLPRLGRSVFSLALLVLVISLLDTRALLTLLLAADPRWLAAALALTVAQVVLSAWRWRFTAGRLGLELPLPKAVAEYYMATFLNQVLPGGVLGDASRAWRHGRSASAPGPALRAVILERASGQIAMAAIALPVLLLSPALLAGIWQSLAQGLTASAVLKALAVMVLVLLVLGLLLALGPERLRRGLGTDVHRALLAPTALPLQLLSSLLVVASYVGVFLCMAHALGLDTPLMLLAPLSILLLLAMAVPVSIAGWGVREGAAALLWPLAGLAVMEGVALSVGYGLLVLCSSLPGAVCLLRPRRG